MTDINPLLNGTIAGQIAQRLDAKDGSKDGKIEASIWNDFVKDKGGKEVKEFINVVDAMNSITTYAVRNAKNAAKGIDDLAMDWLGKEPPVESTPPTTPPTTPPVDTPPVEENTELEEKVQADFNSVKVTVQKKEVDSKLKEKGEAIIASKKDAETVADNIKKANDACSESCNVRTIDEMEEVLKTITKDNVIYVLEKLPDLITMIDDIDLLGYGFDEDEVLKYVIEPLIAKAEALGLSEKYKDFIANASKLSLTELKNNAGNLAKECREKEGNNINLYYCNLETVENFNENIDKAQKTFDDANRFMAEVANMEPKPEIKSGHNDTYNYDWKTTELPDGRWISVIYDDNGEITSIDISHDTTLDTFSNADEGDYAEITYQREIADFNYDKNNWPWKGDINSGYDFDKLKALAEKIFGSPNQ